MSKFRKRAVTVTLSLSAVLIVASVVPLVREGNVKPLMTVFSMLAPAWFVLWVYLQTHTFADPKTLRRLAAIAKGFPVDEVLVSEGKALFWVHEPSRFGVTIFRIAQGDLAEGRDDLRSGERISTVPFDLFIVPNKYTITTYRGFHPMELDETGAPHLLLPDLPRTDLRSAFRRIRLAGKTGTSQVTEADIAELTEQLSQAVPFQAVEDE